MLTVPVAEADQVPPAGVADNVICARSQTVAAPEMDDGSELTVTVSVI
jgi:hypothetical protein